MTGVKARLAVLVALVSVALLSISPATAEGPNAVQNLAGCTANTLAANDDGSTGLVPIGFAANFYGNPYTNLYINNNGNVTFDNSLSTFTPYDFTITGNVIIAPFLADVDTRGTGSGLVTYGQTTVDGNQAFCVNWVNVGYFGYHADKLNSFQLLLVKQGTAGNFDIIFNYDKVQWETGDASGGSGGLGGTSAVVGFSNGDGGPSHYYVRGGSLTNGALLDSNPTTGLISGSLGTTQLGRYIFQVRNLPPTGSTLTGTVFSPSASPVAQAPVEICRSGGSCVSRFTDSSGVYQAVDLTAGSYTVTAHSPTGSAYTNGQGGPIAVSGAVGASFTQNVTLGPAPGAPPAGTTITNVRTQGGIPVLYWGDPFTITTEACTGGTGSYQITVGGSVVSGGSMAETSSGSGHYVGTGPALYPNHGDGQVAITIHCPGGAPDRNVGFSIYIDPSGKVVDAGTGQVISGATVTLLRSDSASGPFIPVADGSAVMSAANRANPDTTASNGTFGWDVIAGYYMVRASSATCGSVDSAVMTIPPPVNNLVLALPCPHNLTVSKSGSGTGTVTSSPAGIDCGSTCVHGFIPATAVTLTAAPAAGSFFAGWSGGGCSGSGSCAVTVNADTAVTATFGKLANLTVSKLGTGTGTVTSSPAGIDCGSTCVRGFIPATAVTLTATPAAGSFFAGWSGGACTGTSSCQVTVNADATVTATFNPIPKLTVTKQGAGTVTSSPAGIDCGSTCVNGFNPGTAVTLTATPAAGSFFAGWSGGGCTGTSSCQVTVNADTTVAATFNLIPPLQTKITKATINSKKRTASFKFSGSGGQGTRSFQCKLDKKAFSSCSSGKTYKHLKPGKHTFRVRARDAAGRVDTTPAIKKFTIKR